MQTTQQDLTEQIATKLKDSLDLSKARGVPTFLGVSLTSWHEYRTGARDMPLYVRRSIEAHLELSPVALEELLDRQEAEAEAA